jgi:hypothetical protein
MVGCAVITFRLSILLSDCGVSHLAHSHFPFIRGRPCGHHLFRLTILQPIWLTVIFRSGERGENRERLKSVHGASCLRCRLKFDAGNKQSNYAGLLNLGCFYVINFCDVCNLQSCIMLCSSKSNIFIIIYVLIIYLCINYVFNN